MLLCSILSAFQWKWQSIHWNWEDSGEFSGCSGVARQKRCGGTMKRTQTLWFVLDFLEVAGFVLI
jgi:hypothetical protein